MAQEAGKAAGLIISLGKKIQSQKADLLMNDILTEVEQLMPKGICHRLIVSYSWLLGATFIVSITAI